ncbi:hypothetical protein V8C34DRAFT_278841 [Trichoderma compactum]
MKPSMLLRTALAAFLPETESIMPTKRSDRAFDFICCFIWRRTVLLLLQGAYGGKAQPLPSKWSCRAGRTQESHRRY